MEATPLSMILGMWLRVLRKEVGLTAEDIAANWLDCSPSRVYSIEGGRRRLNPLELVGLITEAYQRPDLVQGLEEMRKQVSLGTDAPIKDAMAKHPSAQIVHALEPYMTAAFGAMFDQIPKLAQTSDYMMTQHRLAGRSEEDARGFTNAGLARQEKFLSLDRPPHSKLIFTEGALDRAQHIPGQLELLDERAHHTHLEFLLLPNSAGPHFVYAGFTICEFGEFPPLLYSDSAAGSLLLDDANDIENSRRDWNRLQMATLDRNETLEKIQERIKR